MRAFKTFRTIALSTIITCFSAQTFAQKVIKAGTVVPMKANNTIYAKNAEIGDNVKFTVISDVVSNGDVVIHAGTQAFGKVTQAKKSSLAGTKGRLSIKMDYVLLDDGTKVYLTGGDINICGKNRTPLSVTLTVLCVWPCIFIPGTKAVMPEGYEVNASVAATVETTR